MTPPLQTRLQRFERQTELPMAAIAFAFLALYSVHVLAQPHGAFAVAVRIAMAATYLAFLADYLARFYLADPRGKWFVRHLFDLAIILLPFLRPLRLLSLAVVIEVLQRAVGATIRGKLILYTSCGVVVIVYAASLAVLQTERYAPGSEITNFGDAIWWAISTVTTVGYGDTVPVTGAGRVIAVALMVAGVSLVGVVTATLASWIVQRVSEEDTASQAVTAAQFEELRDELRKLTASINGDPTGPAADRGRGHNSMTC